MDWQSVPKGFKGARIYSSLFNFPLSSSEAWFWQIETSLSCPKKNSKIPKSRIVRHKVSQEKHQKIKQYLPLLLSNPFTLAVFITGSLAMNNCTQNDDIDLMFITRPNTLWLCRLWNIFYLTKNNLRRPPHLLEHSSSLVNNKLCDNLYLDYKNLYVLPQNLYTAHEILQAKPLYDPFGIHRQFLLQNAWAGEYLPIAYREILKKASKSKSIPKNILYLASGILNLFAFALQYIYMFPKITNEKILVTQAFFHPRKSVI